MRIFFKNIGSAKFCLIIPAVLCIFTIMGTTFNDISAEPFEITPTSVTLYWSAPGDDGTSGVAWRYDIRYDTLQSVVENWDDAIQAVGEPYPQPSGTTQEITINDLIPDTQYYFGIRTVDESNNWSEISNIVSARTLDLSLGYEIPDSYRLSQNYPNPFNATTVIDYYVPLADHVTVSVYDILGRKISTIVDGRLPAGDYTAYWDGIDGSGRPVASGVYFYRLHAGDHNYSRKMLLLK